MLLVEEVPQLFAAWKQRQSDRDDRIDTMAAIMRGDFSSVFDPDEENFDNRSPNLIQVAAEDTAEAASAVPTIRVAPAKNSDLQKRRASAMERIGVSYLDAANVELLVTETVLDMAVTGLSPWVVWPDFEQSIPLVERRDPRHCYPEPGYRPGEAVKRCFLARNVYFSQLPAEYQAILIRGEYISKGHLDIDPNVQLTIVEWFDEHEYAVFGLYETGKQYGVGSSSTIPVEFDRVHHGLGRCPVVINARISFDKEFRGQFDQVVDVLEAHVRLMGMVLDYADQAVYSDVWVRDLVGEMPYGGGAYIELGPNGAIGRVPPAVNSFSVQQDLQQLTEAIHIGGRYPKSRPGDIDQAIASAKFVEATAGVMNTAIKTYHLILKRGFEQAIRMGFLIDKTLFPGKKMMTGVLRNQEFMEEYDTDDIELDNKIMAEYGLGLGRDPAQAAVLMLQYASNDFISQEFVQENIDGVTDVAREQARIDGQKFRDMMLAKLLEGIQTKTIPDAALVEIAKARQAGEPLVELYEKYVVQPQQEMIAGGIPNGLGGGMLAPGTTPDQLMAGEGGIPGAPAGAPPGVPPAPIPAQLLGAIGAGPGGPAPGPGGPVAELAPGG
jgi:hypothetical protein